MSLNSKASREAASEDREERKQKITKLLSKNGLSISTDIVYAWLDSTMPISEIEGLMQEIANDLKIVRPTRAGVF